MTEENFIRILVFMAPSTMALMAAVWTIGRKAIEILSDEMEEIRLGIENIMRPFIKLEFHPPKDHIRITRERALNELRDSTSDKRFQRVADMTADHGVAAVRQRRAKAHLKTIMVYLFALLVYASAALALSLWVDMTAGDRLATARGGESWLFHRHRDGYVIRSKLCSGC